MYSGSSQIRTALYSKFQKSVRISEFVWNTLTVKYSNKQSKLLFRLVRIQIIGVQISGDPLYLQLQNLFSIQAGDALIPGGVGLMWLLLLLNINIE